jgi:hypothetical protein
MQRVDPFYCNSAFTPSTTVPEVNSRLVVDDTIDRQDGAEDEEDLDDDELFEELENDDYGMSSFREQRIEEFKEE